MRRIVIIITAVLSLIALCGLISAQNTVFPHRWVRISSQLRTDEDVEKIRRLARVASENGLTGVLLAIGLDSIDLKGPDYMTRLESVKNIVKQNRLEMIPNIFSGGYGGAILAHDRNLAEGFEVRDLLYTARSEGQAHLVPEVVLDYNGPAVERMWTREVTVKPYRCYRVTFRAKTQGLSPDKSIHDRVVPAHRPDGGRPQPHALECQNSLDHGLARSALGIQYSGLRQGNDLDRHPRQHPRQCMGRSRARRGGRAFERPPPAGHSCRGARG